MIHRFVLLVVAAVMLTFAGEAIADPPAGVLMRVEGDSQLTRDVQAAQRFLEAHTGLAFQKVVPIRRLRATEFRRRQQDRLDEQASKRRKDWLVLRAFGLITHEREAERELRDTLLASAVGFYDYEAGEIVFIHGQHEELVTAVHELHHALIDQHFNLKQMLNECTGDSDREMALRSMIEGSARLCELAFVEWTDTRQAIPTAQLLTRAARESRARIDRCFVRGSVPLNRYTIQADAYFPYEWGTLYVAQEGARNLRRWKEWYPSLFVRAPRSTQAVMMQRADLKPERFDVKLDVLTSSWLKRHPDWRPVEFGSLGEQYARMWLHKSLTTAMHDDLAPLGLTADRYAVVETEETPTGVALLLFESDDLAEAMLRTTSRSATSPLFAAQRHGRIVFVPLPGCPESFRDAVRERLREFGLPPRPVRSSSLAAQLAVYLETGDEAVIKRLDALLQACDSRIPFLEILARSLFDRADSAAALDGRTASTDAMDARQLQLGQEISRLRLLPDDRSYLADRAIAALADDTTLPIGCVNALRVLLAVRNDLTIEHRSEVLRLARQRFGDDRTVLDLIEHALVTTRRHP